MVDFASDELISIKHLFVLQNACAIEVLTSSVQLIVFVRHFAFRIAV